MRGIADPSVSVTVLAVSHSVPFFDKFPYIMYIANNTVVEYDKKEILMKNKCEYYKVMEKQSGFGQSVNGKVVLEPGVCTDLP